VAAIRFARRSAQGRLPCRGRPAEPYRVALSDAQVAPKVPHYTLAADHPFAVVAIRSPAVGDVRTAHYAPAGSSTWAVPQSVMASGRPREDLQVTQAVDRDILGGRGA
jgi:hypothetical protein